MKGGIQYLSLSHDECITKTSVLRLLGHAVGLRLGHTLADETYIIPYDVVNTKNDTAIGDDPTIKTSVAKYQDKTGNLKHLSDQDIDLINAVNDKYDCGVCKGTVVFF